MRSQRAPARRTDAEQLTDILTKCAIGATKFKGKFSPAQLERMVKRDLKTRFEKDSKISRTPARGRPGIGSQEIR